MSLHSWKILVPVTEKMSVAVNDKMVVAAKMRQKFRIDFFSTASVQL